MAPDLQILPYITFTLEQAYKFDGIATNNYTIELILLWNNHKNPECRQKSKQINSSIASGKHLNWKLSCWWDSEINLNGGCHCDKRIPTALYCDWHQLPILRWHMCCNLPAQKDSKISSPEAWRPPSYQRPHCWNPQFQTPDTSKHCLHNLNSNQTAES